MYKLPRLSESKHEVVRNGVGQMYMDVHSQHWKLLNQPVTDKSGHAIYHTLQQIYSGYKNAVCTFNFTACHLTHAFRHITE